MKIVFIDCESTGLDISGSELITLYAIKTENLKVIDEQAFSFKPRTWLERYDSSTVIHGITREMAMQFPDRKLELLRFLVFCGEGNLFMCHANKNQIKGYYAFDYAVIQQEMFDFGLIDEYRKAFYPCIGLSTHTLCVAADRAGLISIPATLKPGKKRASKSFNLKAICNYFKIKLDGHHNADVDCKVCFEIFMKIYNLNPEWTLSNINPAEAIIGDSDE